MAYIKISELARSLDPNEGHDLEVSVEGSSLKVGLGQIRDWVLSESGTMASQDQGTGGTQFRNNNQNDERFLQDSDRDALDLTIREAMPAGAIIMWSGSLSDIPNGWAICNGSNGTPDLRGRFVICVGSGFAIGTTGEGSIPSHTHGRGTLATGSAGGHGHSGSATSAGSHSHSGSTNSTGNHTHALQEYYGANGSATMPRLDVFNAPSNSPSWRNLAQTPPVSYAPRAASAGAHSHSLSINNGGAHTHSLSINSNGAHTHTVSGSTAASGSGSEVIAKYYALAYIMKLEY